MWPHHGCRAEVGWELLCRIVVPCTAPGVVASTEKEWGMVTMTVQSDGDDDGKGEEGSEAELTVLLNSLFHLGNHKPSYVRYLWASLWPVGLCQIPVGKPVASRPVRYLLACLWPVDLCQIPVGTPVASRPRSDTCGQTCGQ